MMDASTLAELAADPSRLDDLPREDLVDVVAELERMRARALLRLSAPETNGATLPDRASEPDRMLKVEEAADILGVTEDWLYDNADDLPFARKLAPRTRRFSERGLYRWLDTRP